MRTWISILFSGTFLVVLSCKSDKTSGVQEIRSEGPNSQLIRNPVSADMPMDTNALARIFFEESEYDFGEVREGDIVEHEFVFKNVGKVPLSILNARSSCGCTVPDWPKDPIPPGGTGKIKARFNTEGKTNEQKKLIYITANTYPNETVVVLKGRVKPKQ
ncbi:MAG: DUF1573 domain-containing protein [Saprospiraceae bacterium]|nr:DUF1573 domain-containing protein [Saprospiraceae bacterium]MDW8483978.1 DUF1573 domain-containing protein [Saprospiraceae bacterium]